MVKLPVIIGMGGIGPAGRTSCHHAYRRMVIEKLSASDAESTLQSLAQLMGQRETPSDAQQLLAGTLVRKLENNLFDPEAIPLHKAFGADKGSSLLVNKKRVGTPVPDHWDVSEHDKLRVRIDLNDSQPLLVPITRRSTINSAGQLPSGFDPSVLYQSRNHPRGLQMSVYGASDAISSLGFDWERVKQSVAPDQIAVYAGSGMAQLDYNGVGGMLQARLLGKRVTSKQCPLGLAEMPADFINAYVLGSVGATGTNMGACATFLYNLSQAMEDIRSGRRRIVLVGNAEAPLVPEVFEGYGNMGALATDDELRELDGLSASDAVNHRRACRPFSGNCGFTLAESAQFFVLCDDELALELGANIYGSVADVFVNADGFKKSISGPGLGNYITVAKAMAVARAILGEKGLQRCMVQAHGTGTPQNRITESHILNEAAKAFGIQQLPVTAIKSYVGHSLSAAAGDQLAATLGSWQYGLIPGITTIDHLAEDVYQDQLRFLMQHEEINAEELDVAFLNSKGFGGNNATGAILAPHVTRDILLKRHGKAALEKHRALNESTLERQAQYDAACSRGEVSPIYQFGEGVLGGEDIDFAGDELRIPGYSKPVNLKLNNPYE
ncbi:beta-ketoacyl synthase [Aestuariirhabdus litorea]|uniref:Beta-ketoacyl synthase n=1 Tax=Aestuariirhabdus litorea TaxID=2528527 RepID=A0A3P3VPJ7_9GAMM|nr:beta-ketoacyl synthase [Aestuariirhabdus litorea]RRJ84530.1 beta-ketoacyl synthase [Aestuariirhabdus litorea]RWW97755.1 beta-ketoacyl synthase [Endozoicomonadaceae bacterium GTF-13]